MNRARADSEVTETTGGPEPVGTAASIPVGPGTVDASMKSSVTQMWSDVVTTPMPTRS